MPIEKIVHRRVGLSDGSRGVLAEHERHPVGIAHGDRDVDEGADDTEDGGVGADPDGEGEDGDGREAGLFQQGADGVDNVSDHIGHHHPLYERTAGKVRGLLGTSWASRAPPLVLEHVGASTLNGLLG